jgi:hypothetical protein
MRPRPDGDFDVEPGEKITFTVVRKGAPNKATINPRLGWASDCAPEQAPDDKTNTRTCQAPSQQGTSCTTTIGVDFRNDAQGTYDPNDEYTIQVSGSAGGSATDSMIVTVPLQLLRITPPPVLNSEDFVFHVTRKP